MAAQQLFDLTEWSEGLKAEKFDCSPAKQPLAQVLMAGSQPAGDSHRQPHAAKHAAAPLPPLHRPHAGRPQGRQYTARAGAWRLEGGGGTAGGGRWVAAPSRHCRHCRCLLAPYCTHPTCRLLRLLTVPMKPTVPATLPAPAQPAAGSQADTGVPACLACLLRPRNAGCLALLAAGTPSAPCPATAACRQRRRRRCGGAGAAPQRAAHTHARPHRPDRQGGAHAQPARCHARRQGGLAV